MANSKSYVIPSIFTAVDKFSGPLSKLSKNSDVAFARMERRMRRVNKTAIDISKKSAIVAGAIAAPMILLTNEAVKFEDKMADVAKTTGLADKALESYGISLLKISENSRTSIDDLIDIGVIGGRLNIAEKDLLSFTESANKFSVALGEDFEGGTEEAINKIGKLRNLFKETRQLDPGEAITRAGSVINDLASSTEGSAPNITDFLVQVGNMPDAFKSSMSDAAALGAILESSGLNAKRAASGYSLFGIKAAANISKFAKQMKISDREAKNLLNNDMLEFVKKFSGSFKDLNATETAESFKKLGINSQEITKLIGNLAINYDKLTDAQNRQQSVFDKGTSLLDEYNIKNNTSAANIQKTKNRFKSLSITLGTLLLPVLNDVLETVLPLIKRFSNWTKENRGATSAILKTALAVGALAGGVSIISGAVALVTKIMLGWSFVTKGMIAVQLAFNAALLANPIGVMVMGMLAAIAVVHAFTSSVSKLTREQRLNNEVHQRVLENTIDERVELEMLFKVLKRAEEGTDTYNKALSRLSELQPGVVDKFNLEIKSLSNLKLAYDEVSKSILKKAESQARSEIISEKLKKAMEMESREANFSEMMSDINSGGILSVFYESGENSKNKIIKELRADADALISQQANAEIETINPQKEKAGMQQDLIEKTTTEQIKIIFENPPPGLKVEGGKPSYFGAPILSSTRNGNG